MQVLWVIAFFIAVGAQCSFSAPGDSSAQGVHVDVQYLGSSGEIKLFPKADASKFFKIQMGRLLEVNADGSSSGCGAPNFASVAATWSQPETIQFTGNVSGTALRVKFDTSVSLTGCGGGGGGGTQSADFAITTYLYTVEGQALNGNRTIFVPRESVKFTVKVTNWPWTSASPKLKFGIRVTSNQNVQSTTRNRTESLHNERFGIPGGTVDASTEAVVDSVNMPIEFGLSSSPSYVDLDFIFPHFTTSVIYDPTLAVVTETPPTPSSAGITADWPLTLTLLMVLTAIAAI